MIKIYGKQPIIFFLLYHILSAFPFRHEKTPPRNESSWRGGNDWRSFEVTVSVSVCQNFPNETEAMFTDGLLEFNFGREDDFQLALEIPLEAEELSRIARQG